MKKAFTSILFLISVGAFSQAVPDFTLTNVSDGKKISLYSYQSCEGIVVLFTSNTCPYDGYYFERIKSLIDGYKGTIQFILVNSFIEANENMTAMKEKYNTWNLPVPYLADKDQQALDCLGAKKSPEVFLLKKSGKDYVIVYRGAIDNNPQVSADVDDSYLKKSIDALLAKQKMPVAETRPVGCTIRRK